MTVKTLKVASESSQQFLCTSGTSTEQEVK